MRLRSVLLAAACAMACTSGPDLDGPNRIRIDDPEGRLAPFHNLITELATGALAKVEASLGVTGVLIRIVPDAANAIAGYGIGGWSPDAGNVWIYINPAYLFLGTALTDKLAPMVVHELHHTVRHRDPGYGKTLLEAMVSEGLADRYSMELLSIDRRPWDAALTAGQFTQWLATARRAFDVPGYNHAEWFFGSGTIPLWTGYTIGYRLVDDYLTAHPETTAAKLVNARASLFR